MRRKTMQFAAFLLAIFMLIPCASAAGSSSGIIRVGLAYGSGALIGANLENNTGYGSGYRFGWYDGNLNFVETGRTASSNTQITVLKAQNTWFTCTSGKYVYENSNNGGTAIGCYHVRLPETYSSFQTAKTAADKAGGFVAWINGVYQVRVGAYTTYAAAQTAATQLGKGEIVGTSVYAVTVIATGSSKVLFQHDGGADKPLGVMPDVTGASEVRTWFSGYKWSGGFRYERISGGNLTVVNLVDLETYIKGVIPYEMSNSWPLEALKAQSVCARSFGENNLKASKHKSYNFDICNTSCCQVYRGLNSANDRTNQAVEQTRGIYACYKGTVIPTYYSASHGGASEDVYYVWGSSRETYPYLCGVIDPYEKNTDSINSYSSWIRSYTSSELLTRLRDNGYCTNTQLSSIQLTYSPRSNVIGATLKYTNGQSNTLNVRQIKSVFNLSSIHFTLNNVKPPITTVPSTPSQITVNGTQTRDPSGNLYVIDGSGTTTQRAGKDLSAITGTKSIEPLVPDTGTSTGGGQTGGNTTVTIAATSSYSFHGGGNGHQLGMSQYGAYAMADLGFSYDQIIQFYYPGTTVGPHP